MDGRTNGHMDGQMEVKPRWNQYTPLTDEQMDKVKQVYPLEVGRIIIGSHTHQLTILIQSKNLSLSPTIWCNKNQVNFLCINPAGFLLPHLSGWGKEWSLGVHWLLYHDRATAALGRVQNGDCPGIPLVGLYTRPNCENWSTEKVI